jgi:predicted amidohydrolase YtcJ
MNASETPLTLRNVRVEGRPGLDVRVERGRIAAIGARLPACAQEIDGRSGVLIPGLADHHIHLFATAAQTQSVALDDLVSIEAVGARLRHAAVGQAAGTWLRAVGCPPFIAEALERGVLDRWVPDHPLRLADQSAALWLLNTRALEAVGEPLPRGAERDTAGRPTGRLWREDRWLRERLGNQPPDLADLGRILAGFGVTAVTDATATTDQAGAELLASARRSGALPQRLTLMSAGPLAPPEDGAFSVGPVKLVLDERDLPALDDLVGRIEAARRQRRRVAVHCVTAAELALTLAAFEAAGAMRGDRIEHASIVPLEAVSRIRELGLAVVLQPGLIAKRGDRYLREVDAGERPDLHRCASLAEAGIPMGFSSDAPYGPLDPWVAIRAAMTRRTASGLVAGAQEAIAPDMAVRQYLSRPDDVGGAARRVRVGEAADLCLMSADVLTIVQDSRDAVTATIIGGQLAYTRR